MQFTGKIGELIDISGNGFSRVSRVLFSDSKSDFNIINDNLIRARVPDNAAWDYITIISDDRNVTGKSSQKFSPEPVIDDYGPNEGVYNDQLQVLGKAFSGVSGVTFNGIESSYTINNNFSLTATVPSGDTRGELVLYAQSGLSKTAEKEFSPQVLVTGFYPTSGITGTAINIQGKYFFDELMYTGNQPNKYVVSFGGNAYSGYFSKVSDTLMTGNVPNSLVDGPISVATNLSSENAVSYYDPSDDPFDVLALGPPQIRFNSNVTGFYSSYYGNQPIVFHGRNVGTDKHGRGLSMALIPTSAAGAFMAGTSGLQEIVNSFT